LNENSQMKRSKQSKHAIVVPFKKRPNWLCTFAGKRPGVGSKAYRPSTTLTPPLRVRGSARRGLPGPPAGGRRGPAQRRRRGRRGAPAAGGRRSAAPPTPPRRCTPKAGDPFFPTREKGPSAIQEATDRTGGLVHPPLGHTPVDGSPEIGKKHPEGLLGCCAKWAFERPRKRDRLAGGLQIPTRQRRGNPIGALPSLSCTTTLGHFGRPGGEVGAAGDEEALPLGGDGVLRGRDADGAARGDCHPCRERGEGLNRHHR